MDSGHTELNEQFGTARDEELLELAHQGRSKFGQVAWSLLAAEFHRRGLALPPGSDVPLQKESGRAERTGSEQVSEPWSRREERLVEQAGALLGFSGGLSLLIEAASYVFNFGQGVPTFLENLFSVKIASYRVVLACLPAIEGLAMVALGTFVLKTRSFIALLVGVVLFGSNVLLNMYTLHRSPDPGIGWFTLVPVTLIWGLPFARGLRAALSLR